MICKFTDCHYLRRLIRVTKYEIRQDHEDGTPNVILEWISGHDLDIDHIIPCRIKEDHSPENLQTLCKEHHRRKTVLDVSMKPWTKYALYKYQQWSGVPSI
jgi:5-methylcytosine-specific restriction endonuclease McrA